MIAPRFLRRLTIRGVAWRKFLEWGVYNIPLYLEPLLAATWALLMLLWGPGRRGSLRNLEVIRPESSRLGNLVRVYRVFKNFGWTLIDSVRFQEMRVIPDWEFEGYENFTKLVRSPEGAILLTAHMGSYDLGSYLFSEKLGRPITVVRAPEENRDTAAFEDEARARTLSGPINVAYNSDSSQLALTLVNAIRDGEIVAIQGDRATPGVATIRVRLFSRQYELPSGPFALSMVSGALIYPLFVIRLGRRRYRIITQPPFQCSRTGRDRDADLQRAASIWSAHLEEMIRKHWFQWFTFDPVFTVEIP